MTSTVQEEEKTEKAMNTSTAEEAMEGSGKLFDDEKIEASKLQEAIDRNPAIIFSRTTCSYCLEAKRTLTNLGLNVCAVETDKVKDGSAIRAEVHKMTKTKTVPQIFLNGTHIGGCDTMKQMQADGQLDPYVIKVKALQQQSAGGGVTSEAPPAKMTDGLMKDAAVAIYPSKASAVNPLFLFPDTVDNRVVRLTAGLFTIASLIGIAFAPERKMRWAALLILVDYGFLLFVGARASVFGSISSMVTANLEPNFSPGTAKQFANLCGTCFAAGAFFCLMTYQKNSNDNDIGARAFYAGLAGAAGMQAVINFCVGCLIFGWLIDFKIFPNVLYRSYINRRPSKVADWKDRNIIDPAKTVAPAAVHYPSQGLPTNPTDLRIKPRDDKDKWMQHDVIKYCHAQNFGCPLGTLGLSLVWNLLHNSPTVSGVGNKPWQIFAWAGFVEFAVLLVLYVIKMVKYPKKVWKEVTHPVQGPSLTLVGLCFFILAYLVTIDFENKGQNLGKILFWAGVIVQVLCGTYLPALWMARRWDEEMINPGWLIPAVGGWVGAFVAPFIGQTELGFFFFGSATIMFLAVWPTTFHKSIPDHNSDVRGRSAYFIWVACPAIAMVAYMTLAGSGGLDWIAKTLFFGSGALFLQQCAAAYPLRFHDEGGFDVASWFYVFPADVLAAAAIMYDMSINTDGSKVLYFIAVGVACYGVIVMTCNTVGGLLARKIFTPNYKWSPMSYMKLTHEAFEEGMCTLSRLAEQLDPALEGKESATNLATCWEKFVVVHDIHAMHEDGVIFPLIEAFFPGQTSPAGHEHEDQEKALMSIKAKLAELQTVTALAERERLVKDLQAEVPAFVKEFHEHMEGEEFKWATPVARKYFNLAIIKDIIKRVWLQTPPKHMQQYLCWVVMTLPFTRQRIRFVRTWMWASPERAQLVGLYLYRGVDDVTWLELATALPDIVPRGLPGHRRYF